MLIHDTNWLRKYIQEDRYKSYFKPYKIRRKLIEIENSTQLPENLKMLIKKQRQDVYRFYSEITHNVYLYPILGTYVPEFSKEGRLSFSIFGKVTVASKGTLREVNTSIFL